MFNARSLANKLPDLHCVLAISKPDLVLITETWLNPKISDSQITSDFPYSVIRNDRKSRGGGTLILVRSHFSITILSPPVVHPCSVTALDILSPFDQSSLRIVCVYRPPNLTTSDNLSLFDALIDLGTSSSPTVYAGDFNLHLDWSNTDSATGQTTSLVDLADSLGLLQLVQTPTHSHNIIDLVLASPDLVVDCHVSAPFSTSDHNSIEFNLVFTAPPSIFIQGYDFPKADFTSLSNSLALTDWVSLLAESADVNEMLSHIQSKIHSLLPTYVPLRKRSLPSDAYPPHIRSLIAHREVLFSKIHLSPVLLQYKTTSEKLRKEIHKFEKTRDNQLLSKLNSPSFYRTISSKSKPKNHLSSLTTTDGFPLVSDQAKATALAQYFHSVFTNDDGTLPPLFFSVPQSLSFSVIFPYEIENSLRKVKPSLFLTSDDLPAILFKKCSSSLSEPLSYLFNCSLSTGQFPELWKKSIVVPIQKKPGASLPSDFRPISMIPTPAKIFERIVKRRMDRWISYHNLIPQEQFGFVKGRSTVGQLLDSTQTWRQSLDQRNSVDVVYIDLAKAFDLVSHEKLLHKLESFGFRGNILSWFASYLQHRSFSVKVANAYSPPLPVTSGVPQGSVLGPLLFILFLSDLPTVFYSTPSVSFRLFADDIKIYSSFSDKNARLLHVSMSSALSSISTYFDRMQLKLSSHKCVVLHLGKRNPRMQYSLGNHILSVVDTVRDLGVIVDSNLSFHEQCTTVHKKGLGLVFSLFRSFQCTNRSALIHAYRTYILPVLEYASPVWNPHLKKHIRSIERVQHVFTRLLYYRCSLAPYQFLPSYAERVAVLNISTLFTRRLVNDITFARNLLSGKIDQPISHFYLFKPTNGRTSSFSIDCNKSNTNILFHSFAHRTVRFLRLLQSHSLPLDTLTRTKLDSLVDLPSILHVNVPTL